MRQLDAAFLMDSLMHTKDDDMPPNDREAPIKPWSCLVAVCIRCTANASLVTAASDTLTN